MTGDELKYILAHTRLQFKDLASELDMSQQNFSKALKVSDVKTGFLEKLCDVLDVSMDFFYKGTKYAPTAVHVSASGDQSIATNSGDVTVGTQNKGNGNHIGTQNNYGCQSEEDRHDSISTLAETVATLTRELETSLQQKSSLIEIVANFQKQLQQIIEITHHSNNK